MGDDDRVWFHEPARRVEFIRPHFNAVYPIATPSSTTLVLLPTPSILYSTVLCPASWSNVVIEPLLFSLAFPLHIFELFSEAFDIFL